MEKDTNKTNIGSQSGHTRTMFLNMPNLKVEQIMSQVIQVFFSPKNVSTVFTWTMSNELKNQDPPWKSFYCCVDQSRSAVDQSR
jgi:hypothetical protein